MAIPEFLKRFFGSDDFQPDNTVEEGLTQTAQQFIHEEKPGLDSKEEILLEKIRNLPHNTKALDLRYSPLTSLRNVDFPAELQELDLSGTKLISLDGTVLPAGLQELDLSYTNLTSLRGIRWPAGLKMLQICEYESWYQLNIEERKNVHGLRIIVSNLTSLSGVELPAGLQELNLKDTKITVLPETIRKLKELHTLDICGMELKALPEWLPELGLPFTRSFGNGIRLHGTVVNGVDMSIFDQSQETIYRWFKDRGQVGFSYEVKEPLNELKVVFLGDGEAGKSHTIARLLENGKHIKDYQAASTPGIVIDDKTYTINDREVRVHFWDFGGQEILHSMHRMFLTKRTLYVVVLNVREGNQDDRARYWLHNLRAFANGAPVVLVLNKMDMNENASVNEEDLRKLYPSLTDVVKLSALTYSEKKFQTDFVNVLINRIGKMDILAFPFASSWILLKEKLQNMEANYIFGDQFQFYCDDVGIEGSDAVRRDLLEWFSDLGVSFCYRGGDSDDLEKYVVLKPDWITNAIYLILFNKVEAITNGLISHNSIYRILSSDDTGRYRRTVNDATYKREEVDYVLKVFRKFRLSFLVDVGVEFLPMLCDANSTAAAAEYENDPNALEFRMHYEYLPNNVIHRLMVDRRKELDRSNVWLTGARFVCGDTGRSAVVKSEGNLIRILVRAEKEPRDPQRYLDELKESLERINAIMGLTVAKMEVAYKEDGKTAYFDYDDLLFSQEMGDTLIPCREFRKKVRLADVLMQSDFPEDEKQKKLMADIRQACEMLQEDNLYWTANEDQRTGLLAKLLRAKNYVAMEQHRTGISAGGILSGELDLDIRLTPGDCWSALEALNLKSSSESWIKYWNAHLKKLLDNYNDVGRAFLFHVSYVQCQKDKFGRIISDLSEHMRFYSPPGFELLRRFVQEVPLGSREEQSRFLRMFKCVYDCGGVTMTVYHIFVRMGE